MNIKNILIIIMTLTIVGCNSGTGTAGGSESNIDPNLTKLTPLRINVQSESGSLVDKNQTIDVREFALSPLVNITYTNNQPFNIKLQVADSWLIESNGANGCGPVGVQQGCPLIKVMDNYGKYKNECKNYVELVNILQPGGSCIQSIRVINGWNFTSSESLKFSSPGAAYSYQPESWTILKPYTESIPLTLLIGVTQNLGDVGGFNYYMRMLPTPDSNCFYRNIPYMNSAVGKYKITYNDTNNTASLGSTPESIIQAPYAGTQTVLVGVATTGDPIGNSQATTPYLQNYINKIEYGIGTPDILASYDDMFIGLDGNNYAVNGQSTVAGMFGGKAIAIIDPDSSVINNVLTMGKNSALQVTLEGNIISSNSTDEIYCYMKNQAYKRVKMDTTHPAWSSAVTGLFYPIGNRVYTLLVDSRMWVAINGSACTLDWDDIRSITPYGAYYGAANYQIFTANNRALYGVWDTGQVLYYPYSVKN